VVCVWCVCVVCMVCVCVVCVCVVCVCVCLILCDLETLIIRRPSPNLGCCAKEEGNIR